MKTQAVPHIVQALGLACVPVGDMPCGTVLARKPVAAAIVTLHLRNDGHREISITCLSNARELEFPLPALINDALLEGAPTIITDQDRELLMIDAAARRFFVEPRLAILASGATMVDPVAMFRAGHDETALCRRLGIVVHAVSDIDVAHRWNHAAPAAAESVALSTAASRLMLWAHAASFLDGTPDAFFETLLPLRERLMDLEGERPELRTILASQAFRRAASFASFYREYCARRDAGDDHAPWVTFEEGLFYV